MQRRDFIKLGSVAGVAVMVAPALLGAAAGADPATSASDEPLAAGFRRVPRNARPGVFWWWLDERVTREGITLDLQEFARQGVGEIQFINTRQARPEVPADGVRYLSPEWRELFRHALREARRLGIAVGVNLSGGWCMGGPWIPPRHSSRWYLQSELTVEGPRRFSDVLPLPVSRAGYDRLVNAPGWQEYADRPLAELDYRDTAVVAIPRTEGQKLTDDRATLLPAKANRKDLSNFARASEVMAPPAAPWTTAAGDRAVPADQVIGLTSKLTAEGRLDWDVPPGQWTIVRTGHRLIGTTVMFAPAGSEGLSVDWLAAEPVDLQFQHLGKLLLEDAAAAGHPLTFLCDDSFEDGFPNWTERFVEQFKRYRGYDPVPYLPVLSGYLIGGAEVSDRFLHDYRKTIADCMADGHYGRFAQLCHEHGVAVQNEAAGPSRSGTMCMDGLKNLGRSDLPTGEFWLGLYHDQPGGLDPKLGYGTTRLEDGHNKVTKMVASAAHIYGRKTASAESFTTRRHWLDSPATLKPAADRAFCEGINRIMIHQSTAVRDQDGKPGHEFQAGTHFNRNQTWWEFVGPFLAYLGRCQFMLQQGRFVADVLYYTGDGAPNVAVPKHVDPSLGRGFDYDVCNAEVLLTRVAVADGRLVLPDGMSYRLLVLPETDQMPVEIAAKVRALVKAGATIVGPKPARDPGLRQYPQCDDEVRGIAAEVWGPCDGRQVTVHRCGEGRVYWGVPLREILLGNGVMPDFVHTGDESALDFIHRSTAEAEIYFVVNSTNEAQAVTCTFRVANCAPEIWDPVTGERQVAQGGAATPLASTARSGERALPGAQDVGAGAVAVEDCTTLPLEFAPHQSLFVVFRRSATEGGALHPEGNARPTLSWGVKPLPQLSPAARNASAREVAGPWEVRFDPQWGGPAAARFESLQDWAARDEPGIKFYSGTATYRTTFRHPKTHATRTWLELGVVKEIARVRVNGKDLGVLWTAPWRVEITDAVVVGDNILEIDVANLWRNRLIGDAALPPERRLTRTNIALEADAKLLPSGLLGPVTISAER